MENQNNQDFNPTPTAAPVVQVPPVSSPINPASGGQKSKFPLAVIIGIIVLLLVAGSAAGFYAFKPQIMSLISKPTPTPIVIARISPTPTSDPTVSWKTYTGKGYEIKIPNDYEINENQQNDWVTFSKVIKKGYDEKSILISRKTSIQSDPCNQKPEGYKAECTTINGYRALDWRSNVPPLPMGPLTFIYTFTSSGVEYTITFTGIEMVGKDQILSTFKFTDQNATPAPSCMQRPACLDTTPRCMIPEPANGWCSTSQTCNTDADCASGSSCMTSGPLVAGQVPHKTCVQKGSAVPL